MKASAFVTPGPGDTCTLDWITVPGGGATAGASTSSDRFVKKPLDTRSTIYIHTSCDQILRFIFLGDPRRQPALLRGHRHCQDSEDAIQGATNNPLRLPNTNNVCFYQVGVHFDSTEVDPASPSSSVVEFSTGFKMYYSQVAC